MEDNQTIYKEIIEVVAMKDNNDINNILFE